MTPINPHEDRIEAAGLFLQDATHRDETSLIWRDGDNIKFKDNTTSEKTLAELAAGGSSSPGMVFYVGAAALSSDLEPCTYDNGSSGVGATLTSTTNRVFPEIDGTALGLNGRYLVLADDFGWSGIYVLTDIGAGDRPWVLTRATDYDTVEKALRGSLVTVRTGVRYGTTQWVAWLSLITDIRLLGFTRIDPLLSLGAYVRATTLPTYDYYNGWADDGQGATLTGHVNGALPTIDGYSSLAVSDGVLVDLGGAPAVNGDRKSVV